MNASKRIGDLIVISERLADLLDEENHALRNHDRDWVAAHIEHKDELSRTYETRIQGLSEHASEDDMTAVDPALRDQLRLLGTEIQKLAEENEQLLSVAREVNRRVLESVAEAIRVQQPGPGTYSPQGDVDRGNSGSSSKNTPLSLDRSL